MKGQIVSGDSSTRQQDYEGAENLVQNAREQIAMTERAKQIIDGLALIGEVGLHVDDFGSDNIVAKETEKPDGSKVVQVHLFEVASKRANTEPVPPLGE